MSEIIEFERTNNKIESPKVGEIVWVSLYSDLDDEFMKIPLICVRVYRDGSWDGELEAAEG